jgi:hypothetical protein
MNPPYFKRDDGSVYMPEQPVMNRRAFLQALGITAAAVAMPALATTTAPEIPASAAIGNIIAPMAITLRPYTVTVRTLEEEYLEISSISDGWRPRPIRTGIEVYVEAQAGSDTVYALQAAMRDIRRPVTLHMKLADHPVMVTGLLQWINCDVPGASEVGLTVRLQLLITGHEAVAFTMDGANHDA